MEGRVSPKLKNALVVLVFAFVFSAGWLVNGAFNSTQKSSPSPSPSGLEQVVRASSQPTHTIDEDFSSDSAVLNESTTAGRVRARVVKVVDGDTIEIEGGARVRYIGVDTPETVKPATPVQCFGKEASAKNKELLEGKIVELEKDVSETDRYGRLLRYVYIGDIFVNKYLVDEGFAYSSSYPPDVKYQEIFKEAQKAAQDAKKGLWAGCQVDEKKKVESSSPVLGAQTVGVVSAATVSPTSVPVVNSVTNAPAVSQSTTSGGCVIKGNISSGGKIYHVPGCGSYEKTSIDTSAGERMFCSEDEAVAAGWRKAKNC